MNTDTFVNRMQIARYLTGALMKLDKLLPTAFSQYPNTIRKEVITSDCGMIEFVFVRNHNIHIQICTGQDEVSRSSSRAAMLNYQNISGINAINPTSVYFCPLNKKCSVGYFYDYKIDYPYIHDEAKYFQNLTRYDLPEEFFYIEACAFLQEIKDLEIISMELGLTDLREHHMIAIDNLLQQMELGNA